MRRIRFYIAVLFFAMSFSIVATAQSTSVTDRTPEQEAAKQTEKLQKELNLTPDQAKNVYDINLKYARERKQSNKRTEAVARIKKKNEELSRVLNNRQNDELQSRRSRVQSVEIDGERRYTRTDVNDLNNVRRGNPSQSQERLYDRPVRPDRGVPAQYENQQRGVGSSVDRPVRSSENRVVRPGTPSSSRQSTQSRDIRSSSSSRNSSSGSVGRAPQRQSSESRSSSSSGRDTSRPVRSSDSRR